MHNHKSRFTFGDIVYLKTDPDQTKRMVTELRFSIGQVIYSVASNSFTTEHFEFELTDSPDETLRLGLNNS